MNITFTGRIITIFDAESFTAADGHLFTKRRILLESAEQYPQQMLITVRNDLAQNFPYAVNDVVTAHVNFKVYRNREQTTCFNDIHCWRLDK